jgi:HK97 family phage prohead protease
MNDISEERRQAAEERAAFYEAAGIEPGELITTESRLAFGPLVERKEWRALTQKPAVPTQDFARLRDVPATMLAKRAEFNGQDRIHFNGVASVTNQPYEMWDFMGSYDEIVVPSAFTETLANSPDVPFLINHRGLTMARTKNGSLTLSMTDAGLTMNAYCNPNRTDVSDLYRAIDDGDVDEMSFAFMLEEGRWSDDYTQFTITKLDINRGDVSAVNLGANPYTSISARTPGILKDLRKLPTVVARKAQAILEARSDIEKLDRLADAFALLDREEDAARQERRNVVQGTEKSGRSVASLEAMLAIDEMDMDVD